MKTLPQAQKRAQQLLRHLKIDHSEVDYFCFMQRYLFDAGRHHSRNRYGAGVLTLHLHSGQDVAVVLHPRKHPGEVVQGLMSMDIPFRNLKAKGEVYDRPVTGRFRTPSLYMFWFGVLFVLCVLMAVHMWSGNLIWPVLWMVPALYALWMLLVRFCYIRLNEEGFSIHSLGRTVHYRYDEVLKVNFDFAREQAFTQVMEVLDRDFRYRLFYIGRVPRKSLGRIASLLRGTGVDATCSLNEEKAHYDDVYHVH